MENIYRKYMNEHIFVLNVKRHKLSNECIIKITNVLLKIETRTRLGNLINKEKHTSRFKDFIRYLISN